MYDTPIARIYNKLEEEIIFRRGKIRLGNKNPNKRYYLGFSYSGWGIYSFIFINLPQIAAAYERGLIPVIDAKNNFLSLFQDERDCGKENAWEYYFEQPVEEINLDDVYESKNVYIAPIPSKKILDWNTIDLFENPEVEIYKKWIKCYIRPRKEIKERADILFERNIGDERIMGGSIRAGYRYVEVAKTDNAKGHPRVADCDYYIEEIETLLNKWGYRKFFLGIDDREWYEKIKNHYGERCITIDRCYRHMFKNGSPILDLEEKNIEYKDKGIREISTEYILETLILSRLDSLYSCRGSQGIMALLMKEGDFSQIEIYDNGII